VNNLPVPAALRNIGLILFLLAIVALLVTLLHLQIKGFEHLIIENPSSEWFFSILSNPFAAILFGVLLTILVRSSSIVITVIAIMVAAGFPFEAGIFMLMGANVGTTIPNTMVSAFPSCDVNDHCRMMSISSMHYFNSMLAFGIFFPLQLSLDYLGKSSRAIVEWLGYQHNFLPPLNGDVTFAFLDPITAFINLSDFPISIYLVLFLIIVLLMRLFFIVLHLIFDPFIIGKLTKQVESPNQCNNRVLSTGIWTSTLLQSSSSTLYLLLPLAKKMNCSSRDIYPLILGVNVGTCFTTIFLALMLNSELALAIGLAHLIYNVITLLVFNYLPLLKEFPIMASRHLACSSYEGEEEEFTTNYLWYDMSEKKKD